MYYSPLLCKPVARSTSREFEVKREARQIKKPDSNIHQILIDRSDNVIRPKRFGIQDKQGLGEHHEELAAMNRHDHPIYSPHSTPHSSLHSNHDVMGQMNLFAAEACA